MRQPPETQYAWDAPVHLACHGPSHFETDVRSVLPAIRVPTLVLHRRDNAWMRVGHGRYLAEHIPDARLVECEGDQHVPYVGNVGAVMGEIEELVTGARVPHVGERVLATMLFVDIVDSTATAAAVGTDAGAGSSTVGKPWSSANFDATAAAGSTELATGSSLPSMVPHVLSAARWRFATQATLSTFGCAPVCTRARWKCEETTSAGSQSTLPRASAPMQLPTRCLSLAPSPI